VSVGSFWVAIVASSFGVWWRVKQPILRVFESSSAQCSQQDHSSVGWLQSSNSLLRRALIAATGFLRATGSLANGGLFGSVKGA
jgi:hypothetical protein